MAKRFKPDQKKTARKFVATASKIHPANVRLMARGGYRM